MNARLSERKRELDPTPTPTPPTLLLLASFLPSPPLSHTPPPNPHTQICRICFRKLVMVRVNKVGVCTDLTLLTPTITSLYVLYVPVVWPSPMDWRGVLGQTPMMKIANAFGMGRIPGHECACFVPTLFRNP